MRRRARASRPSIAAAAAVGLGLALGGCGLLHHGARGPSGAEPTDVAKDAPAPLPVEKAPEEVIVAAWAEPNRLPPAGGEVQILVRLQKRGGAPYPGVQVRLQTSEGTLYSSGRVLVSDASGRTRDRLTTHKGAAITLNAGGTVYRFRVLLASPAPPG